MCTERDLHAEALAASHVSDDFTIEVDSALGQERSEGSPPLDLEVSGIHRVRCYESPLAGLGCSAPASNSEGGPPPGEVRRWPRPDLRTSRPIAEKHRSRLGCAAVVVLDRVAIDVQRHACAGVANTVGDIAYRHPNAECLADVPMPKVVEPAGISRRRTSFLKRSDSTSGFEAPIRPHDRRVRTCRHRGARHTRAVVGTASRATHEVVAASRCRARLGAPDASFGSLIAMRPESEATERWMTKLWPSRSDQRSPHSSPLRAPVIAASQTAKPSPVSASRCVKNPLDLLRALGGGSPDA